MFLQETQLPWLFPPVSNTAAASGTDGNAPFSGGIPLPALHLFHPDLSPAAPHHHVLGQDYACPLSVPLPGEVVESLSLEVLKKRMDVALRDVV